jgi:signal transduction histidine kinase
MPESERQDVLQSVEDGVQRMTVMLDRILLINKADAQMLEFQPVEIDLRALCLNMVEEVRQQYDLHQCELQTDFDIEGATGCFDEKLLRHIFINLLTNAIKYSPNGGRVVFRIRQDSVGTQFEVSDQGIGIPVSDLPELFEPFHRASNVGGIKGTGLGLTIVKKSVELHQGEISVVSEVGKGTCFKVKFIREATHGKHIGH